MNEFGQAWLNENVALPRRVAIALSLGEQVSWFAPVSARAEQRGLDPAVTSSDVDTLMDLLIWPVNRVLEAGTPIDEFAPRATAHAAVANHWPYDLLNLADEFGWSSETAVQNTVSFAHLQDAVEQSLETLLSNRIYSMLRRWQKGGVFEHRATYPAACSRPRANRR